MTCKRKQKRYQLIGGDCLGVMAGMEAASVDAIVTDPPYGFSFMGQTWDHGIPGPQYWREALRVARPGAFMLAFGGTRTFHRLACAIEDAGWELRDTIMWVYGQGFPKSHDVAAAIDKEAGAKRDRVADVRSGAVGTAYAHDEWTKANKGSVLSTSPLTPAAAQWDGFGTALKPAWEPILVCRKALVGTVAENVQRFGTGGLNIDGCRVGGSGNKTFTRVAGDRDRDQYRTGTTNGASIPTPLGRWPANLILDGSDEVLALFPDTAGGGTPGIRNGDGFRNSFGTFNGSGPGNGVGASAGSAARFFYCAKANRRDRNEGLEDAADAGPAGRTVKPRHGDRFVEKKNNHPTVKPQALMRYLCRLVTPPGGLILDPFCGSGSTGKGAMLEGFRFVGIEKEAAYLKLARRRIAHAARCSA